MYPDHPRRPRRDPEPGLRPGGDRRAAEPVRRSWTDPGGQRSVGQRGGRQEPVGSRPGRSWQEPDARRARRPADPAVGRGGGRPVRPGRGEGEGRPVRPGRGEGEGRDRRGGGERLDRGTARRQAAPWAGAPTGSPTGPPRSRPRRDGTGGDDDGPASSRRRGQRSWLQRSVLAAGVCLCVLCLLGASVAGYTLVKYESIDRVKDLPIAQAPDGEPENFLIVAVDGREGHQTKNTDTIMVVRVDPQSDRLALTSFPRDLMVTIADTGKIGMINSAYSRAADGEGEKVLIDTIQQNFDISINHFVEVNFQSFQQVVDAVGGVPIFVPYAIRDLHSGLGIDQLGCVTLDGEQGLAFARARYLQILTEDGWEQDKFADVNRVQRQQFFIQGAMSKALGQVKSNPGRLLELIDIGVANVRLDANLTIGDLKDLAGKFKDFNSENLETYPLPTVPYPQDENRLSLSEAEAEPLLNVFRGLAPGEIRPGVISVSVLNGTTADPAQEREGLAGDVSAALQQVGFKMSRPDDADDFYPNTKIFHAPGQEAYAQRVARHITSETAIPLEEDPGLASGQVRVVAGLDFTNVHDQPTPVDRMPAAPGAPPTTAAPAEQAQPSTPPPPETPPTSQSPYVVGAPPDGVSCGGG
ncbi:MAG TPA: LCP family protein [Acidimicrobiales bacterium]|nr:LCP family protein [Acidimicrobiales bacterium]